MSGITDIKNAFAKAAPGIDLRAVRMRYDEFNGEQILEFDICRADGSKQTVIEKMPSTAGMKILLDAAMNVAKALGAKVEVQDNTPAQAIPLAEKAAEGITKLFGDARVVEDSPLEPIGHPEPVKISGVIEHDGETYELAVDGKPKALFF
jgi:ABC-type uncharacterized transport system ATPase subunit